MPHALYFFGALGKNFLSLVGMRAVLAALGAVWLLIECVSYFSDDIASLIRLEWRCVLFICIGYGLYASFPKLSRSCRLKGRDVSIEIRVGDIMKAEGVLVVGTNTTFDTRISPKLISDKSVQAQFTRKYFLDEEAVDAVIDRQLSEYPGETLEGIRSGKSVRYPVGTTVEVNAKGVRSFWVAIAHMNPQGTAQTTVDDLQDALAQLWLKIGDSGTKDTIVMPALSSKFGQLTLSREEIVRIIVKSFLAACAERTFCEKLIIVLLGKDVSNHRIDIDELGSFLQHSCKYTEFASPLAQPVGRAAYQ